VVGEQHRLLGSAGRHGPGDDRERDDGQREDDGREQSGRSFRAGSSRRRVHRPGDDGDEPDGQQGRRPRLVPQRHDERGDVPGDDRDGVETTPGPPPDIGDDEVHERTAMEIHQPRVEVAGEPRETRGREQQTRARTAGRDGRSGDDEGKAHRQVRYPAASIVPLEGGPYGRDADDRSRHDQPGADRPPQAVSRGVAPTPHRTDPAWRGSHAPMHRRAVGHRWRRRGWR
jgi:hypothetical protein